MPYSHLLPLHASKTFSLAQPGFQFYDGLGMLRPGALCFSFFVDYTRHDDSAISILKEFIASLCTNSDTQRFFYEHFVVHDSLKFCYTAIIDWNFVNLDEMENGCEVTIFISEFKLDIKQRHRSIQQVIKSISLISPCSPGDEHPAVFSTYKELISSSIQSEEGIRLMTEHILHPKREMLRRQFLKITSPQQSFHIDYLKSADKAYILRFVVARASSLWQRWDNSKQDGEAIVRACIDLQKLLESHSIPQTYLEKP